MEHKKIHAIFGPKQVVVAALVGLLASTAASPALSDITRSCHADLQVTVNGPGNDLSYDYNAQVHAQNRLYANRARETARRNIITCFQTHWDMRMTDMSPAMCRPEGGMQGYPFRALSLDLSRDICAANPGRDSFEIDIAVQITGEKGCELPNEWAPVRLVDNYRIYCATPDDPEVRNGYNLPRQDLRWYEVPGQPWQICERDCANEDRCQAWTYKYANGNDPALCFFKDGVPDWHRDERFISGIKGEVLH
ncbi:PAN domain-containing protein [Aliiroseovarius subalbicans]|uniref:PAN domain-containing protein n=1 Tax=Aliiroseovarius subalbicans TaxID=2925840 RepID=UPI001F5721C2|nr:PAN domain-containing protein [Aliiroseovarius subalbicans]MCI2398890.1 hypothetical protein [Aliiroseovarius subalbicans]